MPSACALGIFRGRIIFFAILENLRIFQNCLFTGGVAAVSGKLPRWFPAETSARRDTPSVKACGFATFPKGTAFSSGGKVSGIAQRRPLGGAGCERSEQTEGVQKKRSAPQGAGLLMFKKER